MRIVSQRSYGGPEVLEVVDRATPEPLPTEIRVRVHAAGINPVDWKTREGKGMAKALGDFPISVGWDVAGVVDALGVGVNRFAVGDRVMGLPFFPRQAAAYADYVVAPARQFVTLPDGLDFVHAAALPLAATTAWQIVHDVARIGSGQQVLVNAAGGGVGHLLVQLARSAGAVVTAVDSADKLDWLRGLGAAEVLDFRAVDFAEVVRDQDAVIDFLGGEASVRALRCLRPGGLVVSVPSGQGTGLEDTAAAAGMRAGRIIVEPDRVALEGVAAAVAAGTLSVTVGATYPLEQVGQAQTAAEAGRALGKTVLIVV